MKWNRPLCSHSLTAPPNFLGTRDCHLLLTNVAVCLSPRPFVMMDCGRLVCEGSVLFDFFQFWSSLWLWNVLVVITEESCIFYNFSQANVCPPHSPLPPPTPHPLTPHTLRFFCLSWSVFHNKKWSLWPMVGKCSFLRSLLNLCFWESIKLCSRLKMEFWLIITDGISYFPKIHGHTQQKAGVDHNPPPN